MADKFDPYRDSLVVETNTIWPAELEGVAADEKPRLAAALHADAAHCEQVEYVRVHTGFCRRITVTSGDLQRLRAGAP
jgi:hypothetical protein